MDNVPAQPKPPAELWVKFSEENNRVERMWVFEPFPPDALRAENIVHYKRAD